MKLRRNLSCILICFLNLRIQWWAFGLFAQDGEVKRYGHCAQVTAVSCFLDEYCFCEHTD